MTPEEHIKASGSSDILHVQSRLKAGQLDLIYENGAIRRIKIGNTEIIRMVYSAVRDRNWGTIEPKIESETIKSEVNSFEVSLKVRYHSGPINFYAEYHISGANNKICFTMLGQAQSDFMKNRIGFCVLHPIEECAGKPGQVIHPDGSVSEFVFPEQISAFQSVKNVHSLSWEPNPGIKANLVFSGDIFEMEDQRNWTDASYKTYSTPLELPFPAEIKKGETVAQSVELNVQNESDSPEQARDFVFSIYSNQLSSLPELGTAMSSRKESLTKYELNLIKDLSLKHLRIEVKPGQPEFRNNLEKAGLESGLLGWPLFVVLYLTDDYRNDYQQFAKFCKESHTYIAYLLPVGQDHLPFKAFEELEYLIRNDFPDVKPGTGVNAYFAELNRKRPSIEKADFVNFSICPQVHASDYSSLVENLAAQAEVIRSAKLLFPGKPIFVSPVSLKQRFNVVETSGEPGHVPGTVPSGVDVRQMSIFAASWTLGSLKFLAQEGAGLVSYYETVGWKGLLQGEYPPDNPEKFRARAKDIFPVYEALKEIKGFTDVIHSQSSHPLLFDGVMVKSDKESKLFLFNFSSENIEIRIEPHVTIKQIRSVLYHTTPIVSDLKIQLRAWELLVISINGDMPVPGVT